ncbi:MAG: hypothetical protein QF632_04440 [Candidatus Woesearchaeota archaeon]|jgi:uncharacterized membrane protein|nr:hypothetical protein [Candidatus Woesearchaeota archaeon]MDP7323980.1 hypothetical protein [Candidatus Woesearchaeota archaeon]MDP7457185.1 hypothetical protein [Candidatus Woesearchaeota archaeon]|tara:strand:- start:2031 stop:2528 length:498 start_codon:yes stop_codon:yes gene_type:complete
MIIKWRKEIIQIIVGIIIYVLLGNARSIQSNPFIPGAIIAVNMIIPVIFGILFGRGQGLMVGLLGTFFNAMSPARNAFELLAILPHGVMGFTAGFFRKKWPTPVLASTLLIGHVLNLFMFTIFGLLPSSVFSSASFYYGLLYETFTGIIAVIIITALFNLATQKT